MEKELGGTVFFNKPQRKSEMFHGGSGACASWMKTRHWCQNQSSSYCCYPWTLLLQTATATHGTMRKVTPEKTPSWAHTGSVSCWLGYCTQWASRGTGKQGRYSLAHPSSKVKTHRGQPTPAETGRARFSGTDISDHGGNVLSKWHDLKPTTETEHKPECTWCGLWTSGAE